MGQRANLILIENRRTEIFYTHWRAKTLDRDLFWGPTYATAFVRSQRPFAHEPLLDEVWGEGGAVLDHDRHLLMLFGGEEMGHDVPLRRLYLQLLGRLWKGWEVRWAHEGVADLADYIGRPRAEVLSERVSHPHEPVKLADPLEWTETIGSFALERGLVRIFPVPIEPLEALVWGPALLEETAGRGLDEFHLGKWSERFPYGGFHINVPRHSVEFWTAHGAPDAPRRAAEWWPGWDITWHRDRFEFQLERCGGALTILIDSCEKLIDHAREILLREPTGSGVDLILELQARMSEEGGGVPQLNPYATRDAQLVLPLETRRQMFEQALAEIMGA